MPANKLSQLNLVPNQRNQIGNQFCCVESFIGHLWEWEAIFTQDVFDVSNPRMLAYDQTLIIIDSVGCAFLRCQGEMKRVGERFVGGGGLALVMWDPLQPSCQLASLKASEFPVLSRHELLCFFGKRNACAKELIIMACSLGMLVICEPVMWPTLQLSMSPLWHD